LGVDLTILPFNKPLGLFAKLCNAFFLALLVLGLEAAPSKQDSPLQSATPSPASIFGPSLSLVSSLNPKSKPP
jgi:hypothetical protein